MREKSKHRLNVQKMLIKNECIQYLKTMILAPKYDFGAISYYRYRLILGNLDTFKIPNMDKIVIFLQRKIYRLDLCQKSKICKF